MEDVQRTIIDKLAATIERKELGVDDKPLPFVYADEGLQNIILEGVEMPFAACVPISSSAVVADDGQYHERITVAVFFGDLMLETATDYDGIENERIIDTCKKRAFMWLTSLNLIDVSSELRLIRVTTAERGYLRLDGNYTGFAVVATLEEISGVGMCDWKKVIPSKSEYGLYDAFRDKLGWPVDQVSELNAKRDADLDYSERVKPAEGVVDMIYRFYDNTRLVYCPYFIPNNLTQCFYNATNVEYLPKIDCSHIPDSIPSQAFVYAFRNMYKIREIYLYNVTSTKNYVYTWTAAFYGDSKLEKLTILGKISSFCVAAFVLYNTTSLQSLTLGDCTGATTFPRPDSAAGNLRNVSIEKLPDCSLSNTFTANNNLTHASLVNIINALPITSRGYTLGLGLTNLNKLSDEEKSIATSKGWTLV